jgi:hypothetical protein
MSMAADAQITVLRTILTPGRNFLGSYIANSLCHCASFVHNHGYA